MSPEQRAERNAARRSAYAAKRAALAEPDPMDLAATEAQALHDRAEAWLASLPSDLHRELARYGLQGLDERYGIEHGPHLREMLMGPGDLNLLWQAPPPEAGEIEQVRLTGEPGSLGWLSVLWRGEGNDAVRAKWVRGLSDWLTSLFATWRSEVSR